jgi:phosphoribosylaminoimidazolecarboxamide formyltransferase/IMP cyclohydrolase
MKTALLSVWDKTGVVTLGSKLAAEGWKLIASGGTARVLQENGLQVTPVAEITGEPEMLGGRVKTLHPAIYAGLLARDSETDRSELTTRAWESIDLVVVNLYPFEQVTNEPNCSIQTAVEHIDIGGVALLRAGAKNFSRVTVLCDPQDYPIDLSIFQEPGFRLDMARKAFITTSRYDRAIYHFFSGDSENKPPINLTLYPVEELRYGENPHQTAAFLSESQYSGPMGGRLLQGKPLSYNNLLDLDGAWRAVALFDEPTVVVVKHVSPCGIAIAESVTDALSPAIASDPVSAFGSIIAANRTVDAAFIQGLGDLFVECIAAPSFSEDALDALDGRRNLRAVELPDPKQGGDYEVRSIFGGFLRQSVDFGDPPETPKWEVVTVRVPTNEESKALNFAWTAIQPVKSNAVLLVRSDGKKTYTVGIGGGQPNRVDCVEIAGKRAGDRASGSVLGSDAFFPFPDGIEAAASLGVTAIIQPGGSRRDEDVINRANELGLAMVFTGVRHFRH